LAIALTGLGPAESASFKPFAQDPQTGAVKIEYLDPSVAPVTKDVERSIARIIAKAATHQAIKTIKAFAHIAAIDQQKDFQAPAEADHRFAPNRPSNSAAKATSVALLT